MINVTLVDTSNLSSDVLAYVKGGARMVSEMPRPGRTPDTSLARGLKLIGVSGAGGGAAAAELTAGILEGAGKRAALLRRARAAN